MIRLLYFSIPILCLIGYFQYLNWKKYRYEGNGANRERIILILGCINTTTASIGCVIRNLEIVAVCLFINTMIGVALYWKTLKQLLPFLTKK